jgi:hypothetical protein
MKTLKLRGQRIDNGEWVYGDYFKTPLTDENSGTDPKDGWFFLSGELRHCIRTESGSACVITPHTLGQFTGFNNNGQDWYLGDILEKDSDWYQIGWDDEQGRWLAIGMASTTETVHLCEMLSRETWVHGNVHQIPPEILQREAEDI